ncbi:hypothetical protein CKL74_15005 [Salmonella enterica subsp. enterica serovar Java]|nr:response regulator [Salmonella enterica subsp. enterica serovar Java]EDK7465862.1 hypothetical protein [Salmonella enterica subsp. enterica serovar Java]EDS3857806.1 response regulator [Salmonella enterica subsp. enterica serovar Java]
MQQPQVWLVEDEQGIADTLIYTLQLEGFTVELFARGLPALEKARQQRPDAVILDVGLPDISGFELCRQLLERHPALPRIFDRFYSLPRENGRKSSGLGLAFVSEAARLLNGEVTLCNRPEGGVLASLTLHRHFT